jgi:hypothetical protein
MMVRILVEMLRPVVMCLVLVYKVRCGGEGSVLHGVWQVHETAKNLFLGVRPPPPGQHVPPRVQYGTAC